MEKIKQNKWSAAVEMCLGRTISTAPNLEEEERCYR